MSEVIDQDANTSFMMNMKSKLTPTIGIAVTLPTVVKPSWVDMKAEKVLYEWLKPFGAEWTLRGIVQAKTESEAKAILKNWIHKARAEEVVDSMIEGMQKAMRVDMLWWLKELRQPRRYISMLSGKGKDLTIDVQIETLENITKIVTTALVDSGDEPPGSVRSEFADLSIYHPISSKRHHYNPHTLDNTMDFRSIGHKHSDTILEL